MFYTRKQNIFKISPSHYIQQRFPYGVECKGFHSWALAQKDSSKLYQTEQKHRDYLTEKKKKNNYI